MNHIKTVIPKDKCMIAESCKNYFDSCSDDLEIINYLNNNFKTDFTEVLELGEWESILSRLNSVLHTNVLLIPTFFNLIKEPNNNSQIYYLVSSILIFYIKLFKAADDKRYFFFFEDIEYCMKAVNLDISILAFEVLFYVSVPPSSISALLHDDLTDLLEIPDNIARLAFLVFRSLGLGSYEFGFADYLRGIEHSNVNMLENSITLQFPSEKDCFKSCIIAPLKNYDVETILEFKENNSLSNENLWSAILMERVLTSYQQSVGYREKIVKLRLNALFIVIHSREEVLELSEYTKINSPMLLDLVAFSDPNGEIYGSFQSSNPLELVHHSLENVLGLVESKFRRRSSYLIKSSILDVLNLTKESRSSSSSHVEDAWVSIVSSACACSHPLFLDNASHESQDDNTFNSIGKLARLGLELYALTLSARGPYTITIDIRIVGVVVNLLKTTVDKFKQIISSPNIIELASNKRTINLLLLIDKLLYCCELTVEASQNTLTIFRELDGITSVSQIIDSFANCQLDLIDLFQQNFAFTRVLQSSFSLLLTSIQKNRNTSLTTNIRLETGLNIPYGPQFMKLGKKIFKDYQQSTAYLWIQLISVLKETIDFEPGFLSTFLNSEFAEIFSSCFQRQVPFQLFHFDGKIDIDSLLIPLSRFSASICITTDGKQYLEKSCLIEFIVDASTHPITMLPRASASTPERLIKVGKLISRVIQDDGATKTRIQNYLKRALTSGLAFITEYISDPSLLFDDKILELDSDRSINYQKLGNLCILIENIYSEQRRAFLDSTKEIIIPNISELLDAYLLSFPPYRQLLVQVSIRNQTGIPTYGNSSYFKSISSLMNFVISLFPQIMLEKLFNKIEDNLSQISVSKQFLCDDSQNEKADDSASIPNSRRRSRGSSVGNQSGVNVMIQGILEAFPNKAIIDNSFEDSFPTEKHKFHMWNFLTCIFRVEKLSIMLSQSLRISQRSSNLLVLINCKDTIRRLFAFYRSCTLEVSRYFTLKYNVLDLKECKTLDSLIQYLNPEEDASPIDRVPEIYKLRVVSSTGALIREGIEIDGSRIVFTAEVGSEILAYERKVNSAGVSRFRTALGWLSEYRRDQSRSSLVEILDVYGINSQENSKTFDISSKLFTLQEGASMSLIRLQVSFRHVATNLAKVIPPSDFPRSNTLPLNETQVALLLTNVLKGFYENSQLGTLDNDKSNRENFKLSLTSSSGSIISKQSSLDEEIKDSKGDEATLCLYYRSIIRHLILPTIEDKNGNIVLLLFRLLFKEGILRSFLQSFEFIVKILYNSIESSTNEKLDRKGLCAYQALSSHLAFLRKIVTREYYVKSNSTNTPLFIDDKGNYKLHDFLYEILRSICETIIPMVQNGIWNKFPSDLQCEWFQFLSLLINNLNNPLLPSREFPSSSSRTLSSDRGSGSSAHRLGGRITPISLTGNTPNSNEPILRRVLDLYGNFPVDQIMSNPSTPIYNNDRNDLVANLDLDSEDPLYSSSQHSPLEASDSLPSNNSSRSSLGNMFGSFANSSIRSEDRNDNITLNITLQNENLKQFYKVLQDSFLQNLLTLCKEYHFLVLWGKSKADVLFRSIITAIESFKTKIPSNDILFISKELLRQLQDGLKCNCDISCYSPNIYGIILLITLILRSDSLLIDGGMISPTYYMDQIVFIVDYTKGMFANPEKSLPGWLAPLLLLLTELFKKVSTSDLYFKELLKSIFNESDPNLKSSELVLFDISLLTEYQFISFNMIKQLISNYFKQSIFTVDECLALMIFLEYLLKNQEIADDFVNNKEIFNNFFNIRVQDKKIDNLEQLNFTNRLTPILQKLFETRVELQLEIYLAIQKLFDNLPTNEKQLPFSKFMIGLSSYLLRSPQEFYIACKNAVKFVRTKDASGSENSIIVKIQETKDMSVFKDINQDSRSLRTFKSVLYRIGSLVKSSEANCIYFLDYTDCVNALSDCLLTFDRLPPIASQVIKKIESKEKDSLLSILLRTYLVSLEIDNKPNDLLLGSQNNNSIENTYKLHLWATTRFFIALTAVRGFTRISSLDVIVKEIGSISKSKCLLGERKKKNSYLTKLCSLLLLTIRSLKDRNHNNTKKRDDIISIDTVGYLLESTKILNTLYDCFFNSSVGILSYPESIKSILNLLELLTRPALLDHVQKISESKLEQKNENKEEFDPTELHIEETIPSEHTFIPDHFISNLPETTNNQTILNQFFHEQADEESQDEEEDDEDDDDEEDDGEENNENDEEEIDIENEDESDEEIHNNVGQNVDVYENRSEYNSESNSDDEDSDDDDDYEEEDETGIDYIEAARNRRRVEEMMFSNRFPQSSSNIHSTITNNQDSFIQIEGSNNIHNLLGSLLNEHMQNHSSLREGFETSTGSAESFNFITPPDRRNIFVDNERTLNIFVEPNTRNGPDLRVLAMTDALRRLSADLGLPNMINQLPTPARQPIELLPNGLQSALEVRSQNNIHPLFQASNNWFSHSPQLPPIPIRTGLQGQFLSEEISIPDRMAQLSYSSLLGNEGILDLFPAVYPRNSFEISRTPSQVSTPIPTNDINNIINDLQSNLQYNFNLIDDDTMGDDFTEDASQSSATLTTLSRTAPRLDFETPSVSIQSSMQAMQDPNPRQLGEEDTVDAGPIPPMIEIEPTDIDEGNEELSVLTIPQDVHSVEENTQPVNTLMPLEEALQENEDDISESISNSSQSSSSQSVSSSNDEEVGSEINPGENTRDMESLMLLSDIDLNSSQQINSDDQPQSPYRLSEMNFSNLNQVENMASPSSTGLVCPPGYDLDVFNSLPHEMQLEVISMHSETSENIRELAEAAGFDYETLMSLPEDIRQEVLDQARSSQASTSNAVPTSTNENANTSAPQAQEIDNASFLASLPLELRSEILLTAEPDFLASLSAEIQAEAQNLRERAASNWQRREIIAQVTGNIRGQPIGNLEPSDIQDNFELDNGEEFDDEEDNGPIFMPNRSRNRSRLEETESPVVTTISTPNYLNERGRLVVQKEKTYYFPFLNNLLVALIKAIIIPIKQSSDYTETLIRSIKNVCSTFHLKDNFIKLLFGILLEDFQLSNHSLQMLTNGSIKSLDSLKWEDEPNNIDNSNLPIVIGRKRSSETILLNSIAIQRIFFVLKSLNSSFPVFSYLLWTERTRDNNFDLLPQDDLLVSKTLSNELTSRPTSKNGLIKLLFGILSRLLNSTNVPEMEAVVDFLQNTTTPLGSFPDTLDTSQINESEVKDNDSSLELRVPLVMLDRDNLQEICDVILSDLCTQKIFQDLTTILSSLSKVDHNSHILVDLLREVIIDLGEQAHLKLQFFKETIDETISTKNCNSSQVALILPMGDHGMRIYEKFLRLMQTLHSLSKKNHRHFTSISPMDELIQVWNSLDSILNTLKYFLEEETKENLPSSTNTSGSPYQTSLLATFKRLLPIIEAFFLSHTSDLLEDKQPNPAVSEINSTDVNNAHNTSIPAQPIPVSIESAIYNNSTKIPGEKFRISNEYRQMNISILNDQVNNDHEKGSPLSHSRSFRKQPSLTHTSSLTKTSSLIPTRHHRLMSLVTNHKFVLNTLIHSKPNLLETSFSSLIRVTQLRHHLNFENKRKYFYNNLKKITSSTARRTINIQIRRNQVFEDSYQQLRSKSATALRSKLQISFYGEEGFDAGGLTREWYNILSRDIFNPNYALFAAAADGATFQPYSLSFVNSNHLDYFKFVGRIIGKAICDEQLMDAHFTKSFYKHLLGVSTDFNDLESTEPDYYKSLKTMLEYSLEDVGMTGMTFTAEIQKFGRTEEIDLIPNGNQILVTDDNKQEYIRLVAHHRMTSAIVPQIEAFMTGFYEQVPPEMICIFTPAELELLICGLPDINIDELKMFTDYHQYHATDDIIVWFWEALESFSREERAAFLQFVTGTSKVPLGGFANLQGMRGNQKFSIHRAFGAENGVLPSAHTCYNQLDLPQYKSSEELHEKLLIAITEGSEGFGFA